MRLKETIGELERQNELFLKLPRIYDRKEVIVNHQLIDGEEYAVGLETNYNHKGQIESAHFYLYVLSEKLSPTKDFNHIWLIFNYHNFPENDYLENILIKDFLGKTDEVGKGYGSYNFKVMLDWVQNNFGQRTKIKGWLSSVDERDENNKKRRNHVYEKFGFSIVGDWAILDEVGNRKI